MTTPLSPWRPPILAAGVFVAAYLITAAIGAAVAANFEFVFYLVVMVVLALAVAGLHQRVHLSAPAIWALAIWGAMHMAGGLVPLPEGWPYHGETAVLYSWWLVPSGEEGGYLKYDHAVHAYGFAVASWVCWEALRSAAGFRRASVGVAVLCGLGGLGLGAMNEVIEFAATLLVPETNVGGYVNTGWDLVANTCGAAFAVALIWTTSRRSQPVD